jgi:hypothetical protein
MVRSARGIHVRDRALTISAAGLTQNNVLKSMPYTMIGFVVLLILRYIMLAELAAWNPA